MEGVNRVIRHTPEKKDGEEGLPLQPYSVYNIGNNNTGNYLAFIQTLSGELVRAKVFHVDYDFEVHKIFVLMQSRDVPITYADTSALVRDFGFKTSTSLRDGLLRFSEWYHEFYQNK